MVRAMYVYLSGAFWHFRVAAAALFKGHLPTFAACKPWHVQERRHWISFNLSLSPVISLLRDSGLSFCKDMPAQNGLMPDAPLRPMRFGPFETAMVSCTVSRQVKGSEKGNAMQRQSNEMDNGFGNSILYIYLAGEHSTDMCNPWSFMHVVTPSVSAGGRQTALHSSTGTSLALAPQGIIGGMLCICRVGFGCGHSMAAQKQVRPYKTMNNQARKDLSIF